MDADITFGAWLKRQRRMLDLTQKELAQQVGCAVVTIRKFETDERRPSKELAERLAACLKLAPEEYANFITFARAEPFFDAVSPPAMPPPLTPPTAQLKSLPPVRLPAFLEPATSPETTSPVFVARERELAELEATLETARAGQGQILFVIGGAGRGKTMLLQEFARRAQAADPELLVFSGYCNAHTGTGDPYLPFREALTLLVGEVEAKWAGGLITSAHARRLWEAMPLTLPALVEHAPDLVNTFVPGKALQEWAATFAPPEAAWFSQLTSLVAEGQRANLEQKRILTQYTALLKAIAAQHPLLLIIEDLHWVDASSSDLLFHLSREVSDSRILIVGTYRPEEIPLSQPKSGSEQGARHPLSGIVSELKRRHGDIWLDLREMTPTEGRHFVEAYLDTQPNQLGQDFREELFRHTGGHALFTVELLREMVDRGDIRQDEAGLWVAGEMINWHKLPAKVEGVIERRINRLEAELQAVLTIASVEGESFTAEVVARVQQLNERSLIQRLSQELDKQHRLVTAQALEWLEKQRLSIYRFRHHLFQHYLYHHLDEMERVYLHEAVANVLETLYGDQKEKAAVQLAWHFEQAGLMTKAIDYLLQAGNQARRLSANQEAIGYFQRALTHLDALHLVSDPHYSSLAKEWRLAALRGLGQVYLGLGKLAEAEGSFRQAIVLGREIRITPREIVRLYYWWEEVLWWQGRFAEDLILGEEGLALLGDDTESLEAALMNLHIALGSWDRDWERVQKFIYRNAQFVHHLPYSEELRAVYLMIAMGCAQQFDKKVEEGLQWLQALKEQAIQHHDLGTLAEMHVFVGVILRQQGDGHGAIGQFQRSLELCTKIGEAKLATFYLPKWGSTLLMLGALQKAEECLRQSLEIVQARGFKFLIFGSCWFLGTSFLAQSAPEKAVNTLQAALPQFDATDVPWTYLLLGRAYLAQEQQAAALRHFQEALALTKTDRPSSCWFYDLRPPYAGALSGLEEAYQEADTFRAFCQRFREEYPEVGAWPLVQWYLEPTQPDYGFTIYDFGFEKDNLGSKIENLKWIDPFGDCSFEVEEGLVIHAANGRDLWFINWSAPRLIRPIAGDFAMQTLCVPPSDEKPAMGGLLLWKDRENYLRLDRGIFGQREILFGGCLANRDIVIGRGQLPETTEVSRSASAVFLRLERLGHHVKALCSTDGQGWFTVGQTEFPVEGPVEVGLHAIGNIDRTIYHGAYPDGTAIQFESFQAWQRPPSC